MEEVLQQLLDELECPTSSKHSLLKINVTENFSYNDFNDQTLREYFIPPSLTNFLSTYFSLDLFSENCDLIFTEEDRINSDFNFVFVYLLSLVYHTITLYFLFFSLPVSNLKLPSKFQAFKTNSSSVFSIEQSHTYFKIFLPLEDCDIAFMYKTPLLEEAKLKKNSLYVVPFTICNNISYIKGRHLTFEFSL